MKYVQCKFCGYKKSYVLLPHVCEMCGCDEMKLSYKG